MTEEKKGKNVCKKPFKQTRQLIKMALNDNWTQKEIADTCRVQQSIVSGWKNGSKFGTEIQLSPLLEIYGHKLRRNTFKVYWHIDTETNEKTYFRVEGRVILSENIFDNHQPQGRRGKPLSKFRIIIHYQGNGKFRVVIQYILTIEGMHKSRSNSQDDDTWSSTIEDPLDASKLVQFIDNVSENIVTNHKADASTLPFLIRKALLNNGFQVDGIVDHPASW